MDFNRDVLAIGDQVLFARAVGVLAEGTVVGIMFNRVAVQSLTCERRMTLPSDGVIKVAE